MRRRRQNHNRGLMFAIMTMALVVIGVVMGFWFWCFPNGATRQDAASFPNSHIVLAKGFLGDSIQLHINDSIVFDARIYEDSLDVALHLAGESNFLMVVLPDSDRVSSFDLPADGGRFVLYKDEGWVSMESF